MSDIYIEEADIAWMNKAACSGMDINLFFPSDGVNLSREIKAVCDGCPVKMNCYIYAEKNHLDYGAFGGMSARERHDSRGTQGRSSYRFQRLIA
jgi:WhiB family redox-sensing transcriptional regulator